MGQNFGQRHEGVEVCLNSRRNELAGLCAGEYDLEHENFSLAPPATRLIDKS